MSVQGNPEQLKQRLERELAPLYVIFGAEPLLLLESVDAVVAAARKRGYDERQVLTVEPGFRWEQLLEASRSLSLFSSNKLIELRIPAGKPGNDGAEAIICYCERLPENVVTIVTLPRPDKAAMSSTWFAALQRHGVNLAAEPVERERLPAWIANRLNRHGLSADRQTLQLLADRVEGNLLAARNEVEKLALLFPPGTLAFADVRHAIMTSSRYDVLALAGAALAGEAARCHAILLSLKQAGEAAPLILWALTEELRALIKIKSGLGAGAPIAQLLRAARVWGPRQKWLESAARRLPEPVLSACLRHAARIDRMIKGTLAGDGWDELANLALALAGVSLPSELAA